MAVHTPIWARREPFSSKHSDRMGLTNLHIPKSTFWDLSKSRRYKGSVMAVKRYSWFVVCERRLWARSTATYTRRKVCSDTNSLGTPGLKLLTPMPTIGVNWNSCKTCPAYKQKVQWKQRTHHRYIDLRSRRKNGHLPYEFTNFYTKWPISTAQFMF